MTKRLVLSLLSLWAITNAVLTYRDAFDAPTRFRLKLAAISLGDQMVFIAVIYLAWTWISESRKKRRQA